MVGIVIVSHSEKLAQGVVELCQMLSSEINIAAAGGMDDGGLGTSFRKIQSAIDRVYSPQGVLILVDMGSSVMTAEMVVEAMRTDNVYISSAPIVEGAVVASMSSVLDSSLDEVIQSMEDCTRMKGLD